MVNENLIPKTETVYELKDKIPTYEEFMKTYQSDKVIENSYLGEYQDQVLYGPQYGPGNSESCRRHGEQFNTFAYKPHITEITVYSSYIRFKLNRNVKYRDGWFNHIDCANNSTYRDYKVNDDLWIDKDEFKSSDSSRTFDSLDFVRKRFDDENDLEDEFIEFCFDAFDLDGDGDGE